MAINTTNLQLLEKDTTTDGNDTFNIKTILNDNWDKIDADSKVKSDAIASNSSKIGTLANLGTIDKSSTVNAINETSNKIGLLTTNIATNTTAISNINMYTTAKLNIDVNNIWTEVDLKRKDGTLIVKSVLSGGTSPTYTTRTETYYAVDGTTVTNTVIYTRTYNIDGILITEVMN